jgi:hypothetical protein
MAGLNLFNTKECEWADIKVHIAGAEVKKLRHIKYKSAKELEELYGAGDRPLSLQSGNRSFNGTLEVYAGVLRDINAAAIAAGGADALDLAFDVVVSYKANGARTLLTRTLIGVQLSEFEEGMTQGDKNSVISMPFKCIDVVGI